MYVRIELKGVGETVVSPWRIFETEGFQSAGEAEQ